MIDLNLHKSVWFLFTQLKKTLWAWFTLSIWNFMFSILASSTLFLLSPSSAFSFSNFSFISHPLFALASTFPNIFNLNSMRSAPFEAFSCCTQFFIASSDIEMPSRDISSFVGLFPPYRVWWKYTTVQLFEFSNHFGHRHRLLLQI